ncbi:MAG: hypothetical protein SGILL_002698 [Bacillariaceae sp.]
MTMEDLDDSNRYQFKTMDAAMIYAQLWTGHANQMLTEAACIKCVRQSMLAYKQTVACATRFLPLSPQQPIPETETTIESNDAPASLRPNILAIEIPGLNHKSIETLPSLKYFLSSEAIGFVRFPRYVPLAHDYSVFRGGAEIDLPRLWMQRGYQVFRSSTECHGGTVSSREKPTGHLYHGTQIQEMFCVDHDHPNCLGGKAKPEIMLNAAKKFIERRKYVNETWATFLSFDEGKEATKTLVDTLDVPLTNFLAKLAKKVLSLDHWANTVVAIYSNEARTDQALFFKPLRDGNVSDNLDKFVTPIDLHRTLARRDGVEEESHGYGEDLHTTLPDDRRNCQSVAKQHEAFCDRNQSPQFTTDENPPPPSILSFYADIPPKRKLQLRMKHVKGYSKRATVEKGCKCATNFRTWFLCEDKHPWEVEDTFKEYFMLVDCPSRHIHFESRMLPNTVLLRRSKKKREESGYTNATNVNILFLEVDSVSQQYADRHFSKTRELLKGYRVQMNEKNGSFDCPSGLCSADFADVSLVGANSIPNQIAALAGCLGSTTEHTRMCGLQKKDIGESYRNRSCTSCRQCLTDSFRRFVHLGNVFTTFYQDLESHHVFCRLAERKIAMQELNTAPKTRWGVSLEGPCIDGSTCAKQTETATISLNFIQNMWRTYESAPKFAFLNAMAAHDYSHDWERVTVMAERYDEHLYQFLKGMLSRSDAHQTVIILRSDHGLQRGPMAMDYGLQVEHRRPWTEILVPEGLVASKHALFENQNRMTTGFDLYNTIRSLLSRSKGQRDDEGMPSDWSFDLLSDEIPLNRTCKDARVDAELCRTSPVSREYGVCNRFDKQQKSFCSKEDE